MPNHKRATPLTDDEKRARNRQYQHKRRHKSDNQYARAYRRAMQRAAQFVIENNRPMWNRWLREELAEEEKRNKPYRPIATRRNGTQHVDPNDCEHNGDVFVMGVTVGCALCGRALGAESIDIDQRATISELIGAVDPPDSLGRKK